MTVCFWITIDGGLVVRGRSRCTCPDRPVPEAAFVTDRAPARAHSKTMSAVTWGPPSHRGRCGAVPGDTGQRRGVRSHLGDRVGTVPRARRADMGQALGRGFTLSDADRARLVENFGERPTAVGSRCSRGWQCTASRSRRRSSTNGRLSTSPIRPIEALTTPSDWSPTSPRGCGSTCGRSGPRSGRNEQPASLGGVGDPAGRPAPARVAEWPRVATDQPSSAWFGDRADVCRV